MRVDGQPGTPKALPSTTFAVLRPTPASLTSSSRVEGTCPAVLLDELAREVHDGACLGAVEAEGLDVGLDLLVACGGERGGIRVVGEERTGHGVDAHVGGLRREHGGDE